MTKTEDIAGILRALVLSGRPILVKASDGDDSLPDLVREIAFRAGRRADYAHVRFDLAPRPNAFRPWHVRPLVPSPSSWHGMRPFPFGAPARKTNRRHERAIDGRVSRAWGDRREEPGLRLAPDDGGRRGRTALLDLFEGEDREWRLDPRPVLNLGRVTGPDSIVVAACDGQAHTHHYAQWLTLSMWETAERAGRPGPVLVGKDLRDLIRSLNWISESKGDLTFSQPWDGFRTVIPDLAAGPAWNRRVAEREAAVTSGCEDGVWFAEGEGRTVVAARIGPSSGRSVVAERLAFCEIDPDLRVACHTIACTVPHGDDLVAVAVREAWHAGADTLAFPSKGKIENPKPYEAASQVIFRSPGDFMVEPSLAAYRKRIHAIFGEDLIPFLSSIAGTDAFARIQSWAAAGGDSASRRRQFAVAYPSLQDASLHRSLTQAVDAGRSPVTALAAIVGVAPAAIRRLVGQPYVPFLGGAKGDTDTLRRFGAILEAIGHGPLPAAGNLMAWFHLSCTVEAVHAMAPQCSPFLPAETARLALSPSTLGWGARYAAVQAIGHQERIGIRDFLQALTAWFEAVGGPRTAGEVATAYGTVERLHEASRSWHAHPLLSARPMRVRPDATWPVPFAPFNLGDGWSLRALASVAELVAEGGHGPDADGVDGLSHCVAGYGEACLEGRSLILSIRADGEGGRLRRVSTVELCPSPKGDILLAACPYAMVQHRGYHNDDPPDGARGALRTFLSAVAGGGVEIDASALRRRPPERHTDAIAANELHPHWRPILPRRWARLTLPDLIGETVR